MLVPKETIRLFAVFSIFFIQVIVPVGIVATLLYVLRGVSRKFLTIINLIFAVVAALFTLLCIINDTLGVYWGALQTSLPRPPQPLNLHDCISILILLIWVAGAIGLFFHKRLAWTGSIIGVVATISFFGSCIIDSIITYFIYPDISLNVNRNYGEFGDSGYMLALLFLFTVLSLPLAFSVRLLLGLFQIRQGFFAPSGHLNQPSIS